MSLHHLIHLLPLAGDVAEKLGEKFGRAVAKRRGRAGGGCQVCGTSTAAQSVTFDCCGMVTCPRCARRFATPLGGGELLVKCRCGDVRRSRLTK